MKTVAVVHCKTMIHDKDQFIRSLKYFHPELPIVVVEGEEYDQIARDYGVVWVYAPPCRKLMEEYEMVIHFDADSIVVAPLTEILEGDFDVASVKNNNHLGMAGSVNPGYKYESISLEKYLNIGVFATVGDKGKQFLDEWIEINKKPESGAIPFHENGTFNIIFHSGKYNSKILDEETNPWYYGLSSAWGYNGNHWQSWKQIQLENNNLFLRHKQIKLLHKAGAGSPDHRFPDLDALFSPEVANRIREIIA